MKTKKRISIISLMLCFVMLLASCNQLTMSAADANNASKASSVSEAAESSKSEEQSVQELSEEPSEENFFEENFKDYFDYDCSNKPTNAEVMMISKGMTVHEIIEVIGKPHNFGTFSGPPSLEWKTQEGKTYCIVFALSEDTPKDLTSIEQLMGYGVAVGMRISENELTNGNIGTGSGNEIVPNELYQVLIYDYSESVPSAKHEIEYDFADYEKYKDVHVDDNIEIQVNGTRYSGKYQASQYRGSNFFPVYQYVSEEGLSFEIDDSGMLTSCFWGNASLQGTKKTKDECVAIACDFLANIVDVDSYEIDVVEDSERGMYTVRFIKKIGNFETTDTATIVIKSDGSLYSYSSFMLGKVMEESISIDSIILEKVEESINKKLSSVYQDAKNNYARVEYGEYDIALTTLKDGNLGVVCTVSVEFIKSIAEFETSISERINFVVLID